jgi:predicted small lipoprotein YifL
MRRHTTALMTAMTVLFLAGCGRGGGERADADAAQGSSDTQIEENLGTLRVMNQAAEPVAIHLNGREIYSVPPGRSYTFRNLPLGEVDLYGVGRVSQRHYGLPVLTIEKGEKYEWTIRQE